MSPQERKQQITEKLAATFQPVLLEVIDDSHKHIGHTGHGGAGHFTVNIVAAAFAGQALVNKHRLIYTALQELMGPEIHALSINAKAPQE